MERFSSSQSQRTSKKNQLHHGLSTHSMHDYTDQVDFAKLIDRWEDLAQKCGKSIAAYDSHLLSGIEDKFSLKPARRQMEAAGLLVDSKACFDLEKYMFRCHALEEGVRRIQLTWAAESSEKGLELQMELVHLQLLWLDNSLSGGMLEMGTSKETTLGNLVEWTGKLSGHFQESMKILFPSGALDRRGIAPEFRDALDDMKHAAETWGKAKALVDEFGTAAKAVARLMETHVSEAQLAKWRAEKAAHHAKQAQQFGTCCCGIAAFLCGTVWDPPPRLMRFRMEHDSLSQATDEKLNSLASLLEEGHDVRRAATV